MIGVWLLFTCLMGPQSDNHSHRGSRGGGSDWSWLTGSGSRGHGGGLASDFTSAMTSGGWWRGYDTQARRPGKRHGWFI